MSITHINYRNHSGQGEVEMSRFEQSQMAALTSLILYEIAYGGHISALSETSVEVKTDIMSCKDRTVFTGSVEEMRPLYLAAAAAAHVMHVHKDAIIEGAANALGKLPESVGGNALFVTHSAGLFLGAAPSMIAICAVATQDEEEMKLLSSLNLQQAMAVVRLQAENKCALTEAMRKVQEAIEKGVDFAKLGDFLYLVDMENLLTYTQLIDILVAAASQKVKLKSKDMPAVLELMQSGASIEEAVAAAA